MFLDLSGLINGGPVHGREYIHNPVTSLFSFCLLLTRMGLDHFNDFKSTTELPAGFSVDQDNQFSSITLVDILHSMKSGFLEFIYDWTEYILYASALEKFVMASVVVSLYMFIYIIVFISLRSDVRPGSIAKEREKEREKGSKYLAMVEKEEKDKNGLNNENSGRRRRPRLFTPEELKKFDGKDDMPILIALKGIVYDVSSAFSYYGPSGSYACFAGRYASRAVAKLDFDEKQLSNNNTADLKPREKQSLEKWVEKFRTRSYPVVGKMVKDEDEKVAISTQADTNGGNNLRYESKDKIL